MIHKLQPCFRGTQINIHKSRTRQLFASMSFFKKIVTFPCSSTIMTINICLNIIFQSPFLQHIIGSRFSFTIAPVMGRSLPQEGSWKIYLIYLIFEHVMLGIKSWRLTCKLSYRWAFPNSNPACIFSLLLTPQSSQKVNILAFHQICSLHNNLCHGNSRLKKPLQDVERN